MIQIFFHLPMNKHPLVTQVLWTLGRAGAERMVLDLCTRLPEHGYDVLVLAPGGGGPMEQEFRERRIPLLIGPLTTRRRETYAFLRRAYQHRPPAVWHTHLGGDIWGGLLARRQDIHPWVITAHNTDRDSRWSLQQARGFMFRRADHVACVSEAVQQYVQHEFRVASARTSVIRNGVDAALCPLRGEQPFRDVPQLVSVGRLNQQKDQATLLRALAQVKRPWRLSIFGEGSEEISLRHLAGTLGILPRVQFFGSVSDIPKHLIQADLFCFPSRWEGQGIALLEAMACGVPVIASDLDVFRETFDERAISYAPPGDVEAWTKTILHLLARPGVAIEKARVARRIVMERFQLDQMVESYVSLYERLRAQRKLSV